MIALFRHLFIAWPGFAGGASARRQAQDPDDPYLAMQRQGKDRAGADLFGCLPDPFTVDPHSALLNQLLGEGPAFHQANEIEIAIEPHGLSFEAG